VVNGPEMTSGGAVQVAAAYCPNERTLYSTVCSYNRPTYVPTSRHSILSCQERHLMQP